MPKLRLFIEDLQVQSFATDGDRDLHGTVLGAESPHSLEGYWCDTANPCTLEGGHVTECDASCQFECTTPDMCETPYETWGYWC